MLKRADPGSDNDDRSIGDMIAQVVDDGRAYAQAEIELLKVRAQVEVNRYRRAAMLGAVGLVFSLAALVAFSVALIIGLAFWLGPFGGGVAAFLVLAAAAFTFFTMAKNAVEDRPDPASEDDPDTYD